MPRPLRSAASTNSILSAGRLQRRAGDGLVAVAATRPGPVAPPRFRGDDAAGAWGVPRKPNVSPSAWPPRIANQAHQSAKATALAWRQIRPKPAAHRWITMPSGKQEPPRHAGGRKPPSKKKARFGAVVATRGRAHEQQHPRPL